MTHLTRDERAHVARQELVRILGAVIGLSIVVAGALAWRALDALEAGDEGVATAAVGLIALFTGIGGTAAGVLGGALTMGRED